jgi:hypothetical protein
VNDWVVIDRRFNGPRNSANGGYACGLAGTAVGSPSGRVALHEPPPLDVPLLRGARTMALFRCSAAMMSSRQPRPPPYRRRRRPRRRWRRPRSRREGTWASRTTGSRRVSSAGPRARTACGSTPARSGTVPRSPPRARRSQTIRCCLGGARLPRRARDPVCRPPHSDRCPRPGARSAHRVMPATRSDDDGPDSAAERAERLRPTAPYRGVHPPAGTSEADSDEPALPTAPAAVAKQWPPRADWSGGSASGAVVVLPSGPVVGEAAVEQGEQLTTHTTAPVAKARVKPDCLSPRSRDRGGHGTPGPVPAGPSGGPVNRRRSVQEGSATGGE